MTLRQAFAGMLQLFSVVILFSIGGLLVALFFLPELTFFLVQALTTKPELFALTGIGLIGFAWLACIGFLSVQGGKTLLLKMGTSVDVKLIRHTIAPLLQKQFAARIRLKEVDILRGKDLRLGLQLMPMTLEEREHLLIEAEKHLQTLLSERFGYRKPFVVQASESV